MRAARLCGDARGCGERARWGAGAHCGEGVRLSPKKDPRAGAAVRDAPGCPPAFCTSLAAPPGQGLSRPALPCPWLWLLFASNQAAIPQLMSCEAHGLQGRQGAGVYLRSLCLFRAEALMRLACGWAAGAVPTKTAFRPHPAGNLGTKAG